MLARRTRTLGLHQHQTRRGDEGRQAPDQDSGLREVALLVLEAHLRASVAEAMLEQDGELAIRETVEVLRRAPRT